MSLLKFLAFACAALSLPLASAFANVEPDQPAPHVRARLISDVQSVVPGQPFRVGVELTIDEGWHIYSATPGEIGKPTELQFLIPAASRVSDLHWEKPKTFQDFGFTAFGFEKRTVIAVVVVPSDQLKDGDSVQIQVDCSWLACKDSCIPGSKTLTITLPVGAAALPSADAAQLAAVIPAISGSVPAIQSSSAPSMVSLLYYLAFAFIGGLILNLMPCVLPVVSLKVLSFARQSGESRGRLRQLGLAYAVGTIATFLTLAVITIILRELGGFAGWGFQFHQPWFVLLMLCTMVLMSASLFGAFYFQISPGQNSVSELASREGLGGAFFAGVLATMLSTPCTAPFLGAALTFALVQSWWVVLAVFVAVALGLAAPYVVLTWYPAWLKRLPKPGEWMVRFKEFMAFPMLVTAAWLLWVLSKQSGSDGAFCALLFIIALVWSAWITFTVSLSAKTRGRQRLWRLLAAAVLLATGWLTLPTAVTRQESIAGAAVEVDGVIWEPFSEAALEKHLAAGKVVFIDFTADWCVTCKVNERIIRSQSVAEVMRNNDVVILQGDWTNSDPLITAWLGRFGRAGVPLYVVISPHRRTQPEVLPELISPAILKDAIERAAKQ